MTIDWSLRFGDIVSFLGFFGGGLTVILMMRSDIKVLAVRLGFLEKTNEEQNRKIDKQSAEIGRFGDTLAMMGRYEERMLIMRREIDELKHGRGFILAKQEGNT